MKEVLFAGGVVLLAIYSIVSLSIGITNAQNQMNWCQYKSGAWTWSDEDEKSGTRGATGKRWSPNPATLGLTGECINPGDKGL